jgi:hypothetical protein
MGPGYQIIFSLIVFRLYCNSEKSVIFAHTFAGVAQLVEHDLAKVGVASSSLVSRSKIPPHQK